MGAILEASALKLIGAAIMMAEMLSKGVHTAPIFAQLEKKTKSANLMEKQSHVRSALMTVT